MTEAYDYDPTDWQGHDFGNARTAYQQHVGSSYNDATQKGVKASSLIEPSVRSAAQRPLIIVVDQTASMLDWPVTMFSKLPYLDHEVRWYLGDDAEICFAAIGDASNNETYPLQVRPFATGTALADRLKELVIEKQGGGNGGETYELAALYLARNLEIDPMAEPIVIFIGDEPYFDDISVGHAATYCKVQLDKDMQSRRAFAELQGKAAVYFIQKPYLDEQFGEETGGQMGPETTLVYRKWHSLVGDNHHVMLSKPERVVDLIFGILAQETDRWDDFEEEITGRQTPEQVETVMKSLSTIHAVGTPERKALRSGNSVLLNDSDGDASTPLFGS